jgi:tRNA-specific 2-thiouridylase
MGNRILVGMSGGIDSTWAAKKLIDEGYLVEGIVLDMHPHSPVEKAKRSAEALGIKLHIVDCRREFSESVEQNFVREYANARTPNPCVMCNSEIKFRLIAHEARKLGIEKISTGHYVQIKHNPYSDRWEMLCAEDKGKDQSYFLWRVSQEDMSMFHSVLDTKSKDGVKKELLNTGIAHESQESQEICFIPDNERVGFLMSRMTDSEKKASFSSGDFVTPRGEKVGSHSGLAYYTLGQRKGLGIALGRPAYVLKLDSSQNRVIVGFEEDNVCKSFGVNGLRFVSETPFEQGDRECFVRVRHRGALRRATVHVEGEKADVNLIDLEKSVSPGQSAVFYDENGRVLFGGWID